MLSAWVERDGLSKSVLVMLALTTIACFSYTWGYYEVRSTHVQLRWHAASEISIPAQGIYNARTLLSMERTHADEIAAKHNATAKVLLHTSPALPHHEVRASTKDAGLRLPPLKSRKRTSKTVHVHVDSAGISSNSNSRSSSGLKRRLLG
ncbi:hypothetical protein V8C86DRAFT_2637988 [Haematococcus lacustris]